MGGITRLQARLLSEFAHDPAARAIVLAEVATYRTDAAERASLLTQAVDATRLNSDKIAEITATTTAPPDGPPPTSSAPPAPQLVCSRNDHNSNDLSNKSHLHGHHSALLHHPATTTLEHAAAPTNAFAHAPSRSLPRVK